MLSMASNFTGVNFWAKGAECSGARRGYRRISLTTGNRQPEAEALYDSAGYTRLATPLASDVEQYPIAFVKVLMIG
jgi:hypothetical protein